MTQLGRVLVIGLLAITLGVVGVQRLLRGQLSVGGILLFAALLGVVYSIEGLS